MLNDQKNIYREDINGLRAIAVIAVIINLYSELKN